LETTSPSLILVPEPPIEFGHSQSVEDPRDGLTLFGPFESLSPSGIRWGAIGTAETLKHFSEWVERIQCPIINEWTGVSRPFFPGFEAAFGVPWPLRPVVSRVLDERRLEACLFLDDRHQRVYKTVDLVAEAIRDASRREDAGVDVWFVIMPDEVYQYCRPQSSIPRGLRVEATNKLTSAQVKRRTSSGTLPLFSDDDVLPYQFDPDFRNQLKARLLDKGSIIQIVRESTIAFRKVLKANGQPLRDLRKVESDIAWHLSTAAFYKAGNRPWRLAVARPGVCYVGLAFKQMPSSRNPGTACCAAQMFLDSGDGFVFRSHIGPWYNPEKGEFHLRRLHAEEVLSDAIEGYREKHGRPPAEMFIHSENYFSSEEWEGFLDAAGKETRLVGIRIREDPSFRLYAPGRKPVLRGSALLQNERSAYLWSRGLIPRLKTYDGREVPLPLRVDVLRGEADIKQVLGDVLALTKLNYNSCRFADGIPVTLRFADAVGEILTAGPLSGHARLPFKFYI
jgi:hypothetical protein